jgi:hypothetical protein
MTNDELNRIMATAVMGWHSVYGIYYDNNDAQTVIVNYWNPATDANDSLRVVEVMRGWGWNCQILADSFHRFVCFYQTGSGDKRVGFIDASGIPRAICEAAAKAVGVKP